MSISFGGLASGIDTASLIDGLVNAEKAQAKVYTTQKTNLEGQKTVVGNLSTALASLGTLASGLKSGADLSPRKVTTSDAHVSVAASSSAAAATHTIRVQQTAAARVMSSRTFATSGPIGAGNVTVGSTNVTWGATDTLADIASKITDAHAGVAASVLYDGTTYQLVVTSDQTGATAPAIADPGNALGLTEKIPGRDAIVDVDGVTITRSKNVIDDALTGITITVNSKHAATDADTSTSITLDNDAVGTKLDAFVKSYNAIASALSIQLGYSGDGSTQKSAATLFGDSMLRGLQGRLGQIMSSEYGGQTLGSLGLSRDKDGFLALDKSKLSTALTKDSSAVTKLFSGGGFAAAISTMADDYTRSGDGIFAVKTASLTSQAKGLQKQIDQIDDHADQLRTRLEDQFSKLEQAISNLKSQSTYLSRLLG